MRTFVWPSRLLALYAAIPYEKEQDHVSETATLVKIGWINKEHENNENHKIKSK